MLQPVGVGHKVLADYSHLVGRPLVEEINQRAEALKGLKVLHLSATAFGGGVSEILYTLIPLMRDAGIEAEWQVIFGREEFFNATKLMHNALQGHPVDLSPSEWRIYEDYNEMNARELHGDWDVIIVHDPQPAAMRAHVPERAKHWIWRCHIDLSTPHPPTLSRFLPHLEGYHAALFHMEQYVPSGLDSSAGTVHICPPAIDPLSPKNMALSPEDAAFVCEQFGIDVDRPLICQVSRFDPWKDPIGVIDAYRRVHDEMPEVQLALVGSMATDDPEGGSSSTPRSSTRTGIPTSNPQQHEQRGRDRGERLPVAGRRPHPEVHARGLRAHRLRGAVEGAAVHRWRRQRDPAADRGRAHRLPRLHSRRVRRPHPPLPARPRARQAVGPAGKEHVRTHFLTPRLLRDWLRIFGELP